MTEPRHLRLAWGGATDKGRVRAANQDAMFADRGLFVVADGMGGHQGGEVAANLAVRSLAGAQHDTSEALREAVRHANQVVHDTSIARPELHGMGTTLTAIAVVTDERGPHFGLVNVGDSRIYRQRDGLLHQLTYDHSYVAELMRRGDINEHEAANHPYRNMLTRAIGVHAEVEIDDWEVEPEAGDRYILCSDGLTNEVTDEEISAVLRQNPEVSEAARRLVQLANLNGGRDNSTVLIVDVRIDDENDETAAAVVDETAGDDEPIDVAADTDELEPIAAPVSEGGAPVPPPPPDDHGEESIDEVPEPPTEEPIDDGPGGDPGLAPTEVTTTAAEPANETGTITLAEPLAEEAAEPAEISVEPDDPQSQEVTEALDVIFQAADPEPAPKRKRRSRRASASGSWLSQPVSITARGILIPVVVGAIAIAALAVVGWYARSGYHVGTLGDEVVVYKGRPGGVLWFDPTLEERAGVLLGELTASDRVLVTDGHETESIDGARAFIDDLQTRTTEAQPVSDPPDESGEPEPGE